MIDKKINECAKYLFDTLKQEYPEHSKLWYLVDDDKFERYYKDFENTLLNCLKTEWNNLTREDLNKVASCFNAIARREKFALYFPKNLYESVNILEKEYFEQDSVNDLCRFIAFSLKDSNRSIENKKKYDYKKKILSLSFDSEPNPFKVGAYNDGKGEALLRGINEKYDLKLFEKTLVFENGIKKFFDEKELHDVNWISSDNELNSFQSAMFETIILINPYLCSFNTIMNDDETDYIIEKTNDYRPAKETLKKYSRLLKRQGRIFLIVEYLKVDNNLLQFIQKEVQGKNIYVESVINFYSIKNTLSDHDIELQNYNNSKFFLIILKKGNTKAENIKFFNIDNLLEDSFLEKLINLKYNENNNFSDYFTLIPSNFDFESESDYNEQSDKLYYSMMEKYFKHTYERSDYIERAKELFNENYSEKAKGLIHEKDKNGVTWIYLNDLAEKSETLGIYYSGFQDLEHLNKAKRYLEIAKWCCKDIDDILDRVVNQINSLKSGEYNQFMNIKMQFDRFYSFDTTEKIHYELLKTVEQMLKDEFEVQHWNKLQNETRTYLNTAVFTFVQYISVGQRFFAKFDYSGVISLFMRALEFELEVRFCREYLGYLQSKYPNTEDYFKKNKKKLGDRDLIVHKDYKKYLSYCDYEGRVADKYFTLGILKGLMGYKSLVVKGKTLVIVDSTFLEYVKDKIDNYNNNRNENKIKSWISNIVINVETLRNMRNKASHGGDVLNIEAAMDAFNILILVKKVLKELVAPF